MRNGKILLPRSRLGSWATSSSRDTFENERPNPSHYNNYYTIAIRKMLLFGKHNHGKGTCGHGSRTERYRRPKFQQEFEFRVCASVSRNLSDRTAKKGVNALVIRRHSRHVYFIFRCALPASEIREFRRFTPFTPAVLIAPLDNTCNSLPP